MLKLPFSNENPQKSLISRCNEYENRIGKQSTAALLRSRLLSVATRAAPLWFLLHASFHSHAVSHCKCSVCIELQDKFILKSHGDEGEREWRPKEGKKTVDAIKSKTSAQFLIGSILKSLNLNILSDVCTSRSWVSCFCLSISLISFQMADKERKRESEKREQTPNWPAHSFETFENEHVDSE